MTTEERLEKMERELAALRAELAECVRTRAVEVVDRVPGTPVNARLETVARRL